MFDENEGESQTVGRRGEENMEDSPSESLHTEAGHPTPGEGAGMPEQGTGQAAEDATEPISTEDQGEPSIHGPRGERGPAGEGGGDAG